MCSRDGGVVCGTDFPCLSVVLQRALSTHEAHNIVSQVLDNMVMGIRTPLRAPSPVDAHVTEEDTFLQQNATVSTFVCSTGHVVCLWHWCTALQYCAVSKWCYFAVEHLRMIK